jgi:hypothetical protein
MLNNKTKQKLADYLAEYIFEIGNNPDGTVQRIQFKGGRWPNEETNLGGLCEPALSNVIKAGIEKWNETKEHEKV